MSSGGGDLPPFEELSVVTTMRTPSSARRRRSRRATSCTSPTRRLSTNVMPASTPSTSRAAAGELDDRSVLAEDDPLLRDARLAGELRVRRLHPVLAVDRHHVPRPQEREHRAELLLAGVARDVHGGDLLVEHLRAGPSQLVDRVVDAELVPWDGLRGDDDGIARVTDIAGWSP